MRTIKFRAKNRLGNWVYGVPCPFEGRKDDEPILFMSYWLDENDILHETKYAIDNTKTIGQFTGLHDKNGKEIYEGDIIESDRKIIHEIYYQEIDARFMAACDGNRKFLSGGVTQNWIDEFDKVVIGNIHDNPKLLKGGKK